MPSPVFNLQRWIDQKNEVKAKETKKKAKKSLMERGHSPKEATGMIKQALKNIQSNKPIKRAAGRGG